MLDNLKMIAHMRPGCLIIVVLIIGISVGAMI